MNKMTKTEEVPNPHPTHTSPLRISLSLFDLTDHDHIRPILIGDTVSTGL